MQPERSGSSATWPPTAWEVRRITADHILAFHVSEPGFFVERLVRADIVLVEPPGVDGYRPTGLATAFTELAAALPEPFENACIRVDDVVRNTELLGTHEGELRYGSSGATAFPADGTGWCSEVFASDEGFLRAWVAGRVDARVLSGVLSIDSLWCEDPERLLRFVQIVEDLQLHDDLRDALDSGDDVWQLAEPFLSDARLRLEESGGAGTPHASGSFRFERRH